MFPESESLHEDVRQGRIDQDDRDGEREENNPPSNGNPAVGEGGREGRRRYKLNVPLRGSALSLSLLITAVLILRGLDALSTDDSVSAE